MGASTHVLYLRKGAFVSIREHPKASEGNTHAFTQKNREDEKMKKNKAPWITSTPERCNTVPATRSNLHTVRPCRDVVVKVEVKVQRRGARGEREWTWWLKWK